MRVASIFVFGSVSLHDLPRPLLHAILISLISPHRSNSGYNPHSIRTGSDTRTDQPRGGFFISTVVRVARLRCGRVTCKPDAHLTGDEHETQTHKNLT